MEEVSKGKRLIKNTMIVTIGKLSTQIITFLLLPLYTHFLTTSDYGIVDLLSTLISFLIPIVTLQIEQGAFRSLIDFRNDEEGQKKTITSSFFLIILQTLLFIIIFLIAYPFINNKYKIFLMLNMIVNIFSSLMLQIARGLGDNLRYTISSVFTSTFTILSNIIFIAFLKLGATGMLVGTFIGHFIGIVYLMFSKKIYTYIDIKYYDKKLLKSMLLYSIPLVPTMLSWWIVNLSDRLIITHFCGTGMNGIYSVSNKFSSILTIMYGIFNLTWTESAALSIKDDDVETYFNTIFDKVIRIMCSMCFGMIACMPFVFNILVDFKFRDAYYQIPILVIACLFCNLCSFQGGIYVAKKKSKEVAKSTIVAAIINIVINFVFIKKIGLYAASISSLIAYLVIFVYRLIDLKDDIKLKTNIKLLGIIIIMAFISCISYYLRNIYLNIINLVITCTLTYCINKEILKEIINLLKNKFLKKS